MCDFNHLLHPKVIFEILKLIKLIFSVAEDDQDRVGEYEESLEEEVEVKPDLDDLTSNVAIPNRKRKRSKVGAITSAAAKKAKTKRRAAKMKLEREEEESFEDEEFNLEENDDDDAEDDLVRKS